MPELSALKRFRRYAKRNAPITRSVERRQNLGVATFLGVLAPIFLAVGAFMVFAAFWSAADLESKGSSSASPIQALLGGLGAFLLALLLIGISVSMLVKRRRIWLRHFGAAKLGERTGWHYRIEEPIGDYGATLFRVGENGFLEDTLHTHAPRFVEVGNYSFAPSTNDNRRFTIGYVALQLPRAVPHMYLASQKKVKKQRSYALPFTSDQKLSLEGNFDSHFTLYCPREYERDALYVFTPDLMAMMIDRADSYDIEIVDEQLFIIAREPFDMTSEDVLRLASTFDQTIGDLTEHQTTRYFDDRSGDPWQVGASGQRLRDRRFFTTALLTSIGGWIAGAAVMLAYANATGLFDALGQ